MKGDGDFIRRFLQKYIKKTAEIRIRDVQQFSGYKVKGQLIPLKTGLFLISSGTGSPVFWSVISFSRSSMY